MTNSRQRHKRAEWTVPQGTKAGSKGAVMRKVIARYVVEGMRGREYYLHATKGYRSRRI